MVGVYSFCSGKGNKFPLLQETVCVSCLVQCLLPRAQVLTPEINPDFHLRGASLSLVSWESAAVHSAQGGWSQMCHLAAGTKLVNPFRQSGDLMWLRMICSSRFIRWSTLACNLCVGQRNLCLCPVRCFMEEGIKHFCSLVMKVVIIVFVQSPSFTHEKWSD